MNFPDYNNFLQLQKHLSQRPSSRPAVMVGAGMSLNSKRLPGVKSKLPTWENLARAMFEEIYPLITKGTNEQRKELEDKYNRSNALRIASEYEAVFNRGKLNSFLVESIPDESHEPSDIHKLLLSLPWRDVFTTNYDRLLEWTYVPERPYQVVKGVKELATAESPRIIKLHGSFPSNEPYIITEEDYRTYPKCFAPFVNTVLQSLIENPLVLIGFSGNDPNFLEWIGWIRDELGEYHSLIYLVGLLSLTEVDRALLARRRVTPIDLGPVSGAMDSGGNPHADTLEWFLRSLQTMELPRPERWPDAAISADVEKVRGLPILVNQEDEPKELRELFDSSSQIDDYTAIQTIVRWRYERRKYPGWLIPTSEMRSSIWQNTNGYIHRLFPLIRDWPHEDQILLYREIIWRVDFSLLPLDTRLVELLEIVVDKLHPMLIEVPRVKPSNKMTMLSKVSDTDVDESWLYSAPALLRHARESFDRARWEVLRDMISQVIHSHPQYNDRFSYEQVLWHLWNLERHEAQNLINQWSPSPVAPLSLMWKAGLLVELDDLSEARSLLRTALENIRQSFYKKPGLNIDLLSLEGWCMYMLMPIESKSYILDSIQERQDQDFQSDPLALNHQFLKRWDELKAWDSDPWSYMEHFQRILSGETPAEEKVEQIVPGFDIGQLRVRHTLGNVPNAGRLPAFSFLRLHEIVGITLQFSVDSLRNAAEWLAPSSSFLSPMILIRAGRLKAIEEGDFMNRTQIAGMNTDLARRLNTWAMNALDRESSSLGTFIPLQSEQASLLETLIEFLSRLTLKIENDSLQSAFSMAIRLHNQPGIKSHIRLNEFCGRWFRRLFDAANNQQLLTWLPTLIRFPLSMGTSENEASRHPAFSWPDPIADFPCGSVRNVQEINPDLKTEILEAIEWLLLTTQTTTGETRQRALVRLSLVFLSELMTEEQSKQFGELLWKDRTATGLPNLPNLILFNCLHLPSPSDVDVKTLLRQHLLSLKPRKSFSSDGQLFSVNVSGDAEDQVIQEISCASKPIVQLPAEQQGKIEWNLADVKRLWKDVYEWWNSDKHLIRRSNNDPNFVGGFDSSARRTLKRLSQFLARVILPYMDSVNEEQWTQILSLLSETRQEEVFLTPALPYVLLHRPDKYDMVLDAIQGDLTSSNEDAVNAAAEAVSHWTYLGDETDVENPPFSLINDLTKRVIFRRPEGLKHCLNHLANIIRNKPDQIDSDLIILIASSLTPWLHSVRIPVSEGSSEGFPEHEIPLLRAHLGNLASALREWLKSKQPNRPEPIEITTLLELFSTDPLPEVRRSIGAD